MLFNYFFYFSSSENTTFALYGSFSLCHFLLEMLFVREVFLWQVWLKSDRALKLEKLWGTTVARIDEKLDKRQKIEKFPAYKITI